MLRVGILLTLLLALFLGGCTTLKSHTQRVKLATDPEGADIFFENKLVGQTPTWVELPRSKYANLRLEKRGYPTIYKKLDTSYRWGDSFFSDFIWIFYGAPIAWSVDYINGTAWEYDKVGVISFKGAKQEATLHPVTSVSIAPPQADSDLLSAELGERVTAFSKTKYSKSMFRDFDDTVSLFTEYNYTYDTKTPPNSRDDLFNELDTTHVIESDAKKEKDKVIVESHLVDVFTDKTVDTKTDVLPVSELRYADVGFGTAIIDYLISIFPNTVTFDFATPGANFYTSNGVTFVAASEPTSTMLSILSGIGFKSLDSPKLSHGVHPVLKFVPILTASYESFNVAPSTGNNFTANTTFTWIDVSGGFGPEAGIDMPIGYLYVDLAPILSSNWITATGSQTTSSRGTSLGLFIELGYSFFVSSRINLRLFTQAESVPTDIWSQLLTQIGGNNLSVTGAMRTTGGLSLGYYFPEDRPFLRRALFSY